MTECITELPPLVVPALAAWLHSLDPFLIQFPESWPMGGLRWYGLAYLAGFALAWAIVRRVAHAGKSPLPTARVTDFIVAVAIGIIVGGRLGYVLFYRPELLIELGDQPPFWGALAINEGGMASHGGMIGALAGCAWFAWRNKLPTLHLFDLIAFAAPLGLFMGRIANFINGELYGREAAAEFPLAVKFPQEVLTHLELERYWAGDPALVRAVEQFATPRHASQLYAAVLEGLVTFAVLLAVYRKPVKPGVVAAWFAMVYAVMRVANEFFRQPDEHLGFQALSLTRGQWLSVALFAVGAWLWWFARSRKTEPLGGWRVVPPEPTT